MSKAKILRNYIGGAWHTPAQAEYLDVVNPATAQVLARVPLSPPDEVALAVQAAEEAYPAWRRTPVEDRIQYLFRLKYLLDEHIDELSRLITEENGKTFKESKGEMKRAIENVEVAIGAPTLMQGGTNEDIARGIDEYMFRQPLGVTAVISPFNFPGMIPFWFLPYAVATGNTVIVKPSERTPMTMQRVMDLVEEAGFPKGVINLVNGAAETVNALLDHPAVKAVSFVGSTPVAKYIYAKAAQNGKRVLAQGGAKNPTVIMPDADMEMTIRILADSAFGNAGQRCLATALVIGVGEAHDIFAEGIVEAARTRKVGYGLEEGVQMGPVISPKAKARIEGLIAKGIEEGAKVLYDGRGAVIPGWENGYFLRPTVLDGIQVGSTIFETEIFGPVLGLMKVDTLDEALKIINGMRYGNMACIFTNNGGHARKFRYEVLSGNVGINIGVAAPMAFYPFSGWRESFFGTVHAQGQHAFEFYTQTKVVIERWLKEWSRKF